MSTLTVTWVAEYGYVHFDVRAAPHPGWTVKRLALDSAQLIPIPGFEDSGWVDATGAGYGEDYRPPLGRSATWVICPVDVTNDSPSYTRASLTTPSEAWLRDVSYPQTAQKVTVVETPGESLPAYQHVYEVSGRRLPLVVHDVREGRRGAVILYVPDRAARVGVEGLLATGNPLLLTICSETVWAPCMMAIGDATFERHGKKAAWFLRLDYVEVDDPLRMAGQRVVDVTWADVIAGYPQRPGDPSPVTWGWVKDNFVDWLALIGGYRKS